LGTPPYEKTNPHISTTARCFQYLRQ